MVRKNSLGLAASVVFSFVFMVNTVHAFEAEIDHDWQVIPHPSRHVKQPIEVDAVYSKKTNASKKTVVPTIEEESKEVKKSTIGTPAFIQQDEDGNLVASKLLKDMQYTLLRMNDLSYNLVKGVGTFTTLNVEEMERLQKEGWIIKGFTGLEGRRNTYGDLSGLVCYHPGLNVATIVYHGTPNSKDSWNTNFDAQRIKPFKIQQEFCKDLFEEVLEKIKESSFSLAHIEMKKYLKNNLKNEALGLKEAIQAHDMLKLLISDKKIDKELARKLDTAFTIKLEVMRDVEALGANINGEVHKGFLKKYLSTKKEVLGLLKEVINKDTKVICTGHSQAGAVAELAEIDIAANHGKELFGASFDNLKSGTFSGYLLSAARVGDKEFKKWAHETVGQSQIARQNVYGDPVPIALGDNEVARMLRELIPAAGEVLGSLAGYDDAGYLIMDDGHETWQRAKGIYGQNGIDLSQFNNLDDAVSYLASFITADAPEFLVAKGKPVGFFYSPIQWIKQRWNAASMSRMIYRALKGDEAARKQLTDVLTKRFAHLHYGFDYGVVDGTDLGAAFNKDIVGTDLDAMLAKGQKHEEQRLLKIKEKKLIKNH